MSDGEEEKGSTRKMTGARIIEGPIDHGKVSGFYSE